MNLLDRIQQLSEQHGSMRAAAVAIGVDVGYLSRLASGEKTEPSPEVLEKLGLRREVSYALIAAHPKPAAPATGEPVEYKCCNSPINDNGWVCCGEYEPK